jgi:hypothetical protein
MALTRKTPFGTIREKNKYMQPIEEYLYKGEGYNPFIIRDGWQVAQLNYTDAQGLKAIGQMEVHSLTDEVFILMKGTAILILAEPGEEGFVFECRRMFGGITYNIPVNTWHNIAMDEIAQVIIVEKSNTHLGDVSYKALTVEEKGRLDSQIEKCKINSI